MNVKAKTLKKTAKSPKEDATADLNKKAVTQKVIVNRELKYIYPRGLTDTLKRKAFRQKVRNTLYKLERDIAKAEGKVKKELELKLKNFSVEVLC